MGSESTNSLHQHGVGPFNPELHPRVTPRELGLFRVMPLLGPHFLKLSLSEDQITLKRTRMKANKRAMQRRSGKSKEFQKTLNFQFTSAPPTLNENSKEAVVRIVDINHEKMRFMFENHCYAAVARQKKQEDEVCRTENTLCGSS